MTSSPDDENSISVGAAAAEIGVTVRTLRHWDEIGLARPSSRSSAGYRQYAPADVERLRRIAVYRALGMELDEIGQVLDDPAINVVDSLRNERAKLGERIEELRALQSDLDRMIAAQHDGVLLSAGAQRAIFGPEWDPSWSEAARERYGDTPQWRQFAERSAGGSASDWAAATDAVRIVEQDLAHAMDAVMPGSDEANALAEAHRATLSAYFPITRSMQVCLGRTYTDDAAFMAHYEAVRPGLAGWLRTIIEANAQAHGIDPATATWG
ncbi:MerR family transcriptional regulator [Curtobacterium ammoniigenes]|uniref:MerR family transcriptional regulator n=1 Tax=Curtobacterium ammoniigenes TaxID=395387 RepID=UPI00082C2800|nr:MerR family transcriptional regulator [Curtobacterium ammoniigenes]